MNIEKLKKNVRNVPDFPIQGIQFKDVTTLFKYPEILRELSDGISEIYRNKGITKVVGIESRGFILGPLLAERLFAGFVPVRKKGKLPAAVFEETYMKEYGTDVIQIHQDAINENDVVLLHDDLLATGGTMKAAVHLIQKFNPKKIYVNFLIELTGLNGRNLFEEMNIQVDSIIKYDF
ncbi:MAG: adenine phosphoribosyltransferase [Dysgonamonadaceae bacterium]|jgi:adenine phosphoribosyltransferase|nr:adenine phosphoribosyltransferase [Dysgonamonadaceae bacterium]